MFVNGFQREALRFFLFLSLLLVFSLCVFVIFVHAGFGLSPATCENDRIKSFFFSFGSMKRDKGVHRLEINSKRFHWAGKLGATAALS